MKKLSKRFVSMALIICMILSIFAMSASAAMPFVDVRPGHWFYENVQYVYDRGIMVGTSETEFSPNEHVTRAMIVVALYRFDGSPEVSGTSSFRDVPNNTWYTKAVAWSEQNGIVNGFGDGTFRPETYISREQLVTILYRYAQYDNYDMTPSVSLGHFSDGHLTSSWALAQMKWAFAESLVFGKGNGILDPLGLATRAETAAVISRLVRKLDGIGILDGSVCQASDRSTPVANAQIELYLDGTLVGTMTTDGSGSYGGELHAGLYYVVIRAEGFLDFAAYVRIVGGQTTYMENFLLILQSNAASGVASGTIRNALNGQGVSGVSIKVRNNWNSTSGDVVTTSSTTSGGNYSLELPLGNYTLELSCDGYITNYLNIIVQEGTTGNQNGTINPIVTGGDFRIVLTWGSSPRDLDSHLVGRTSNGNAFHVYYANKNAYDNSDRICNLDVDDTSSYGPETVTIKADSAYPYYYYVHVYTSSGVFANSEAQVKVYQGDALLATYNVPPTTSSNKYWNVFAIVDGTIINYNTITSTPNTSYVG